MLLALGAWLVAGVYALFKLDVEAYPDPGIRLACCMQPQKLAISRREGRSPSGANQSRIIPLHLCIGSNMGCKFALLCSLRAKNSALNPNRGPDPRLQ